MIDINLKYQVTLFGSYEDIRPQLDTLKYFIDAFADKELIPTTFQELVAAGIVNRLSLKSSDEVWSVEFSGDRIDIQKNNKDVGIANMGTLEQFLSDIKNIISIIDEKFPKKHTRLALITRYLLRKMDKDEISTVFHKTVNSIDLYKENEPVEWNNKVVTRVPLVLQNNEETINIISQINRIKGGLKINSQIENIDRIELLFDINTYQGNNDFRFSIIDTKEFIDKAFELEEKIKTKYLNLLK